MKTYLKTIAIIMAVLAPLVVRAQEAEEDARPKATLHVGDAAPALAPGEWLKGEPVKGVEAGKVYVVEFWATWCPPCRASIPHLTELQAKFKDVVIIGQDCMEKKPEAVSDFVKKMGDKMNYRVALDETSKEKDGVMVKTWLEAAGAEGIPTAFLVGKDSKIVWIGHPMELDKVLPQVVDGTFDPKKYAAEQEKRQKDERELGEALQAKDIDKVLKLADEFVAKYPETAADLKVLKFQIFLEKKDFTAAYALASEFPVACKDKPEMLNAIAWMIMTEEGLEKRDLDVALKLATAANEATNSENPAMLDTLARAHFERGLEKAIEYATKAVAKAEPEMKEEMEATLKKYQDKKKDKAEEAAPAVKDAQPEKKDKADEPAPVVKKDQEEKKSTTLQAGDAAPALKSGKWLKGEPVTALEAGKVYIVEFWASWCGPCRAAIPHLSKLQEQFKDKGLIVIGQNCWERSAKDAADLVTEMGDKMNYRVVMDDTTSDPKGAMAKTWMEAAGRNGIPSSFVVDKTGKIAWIGHPMGLDKVLPKVLDGTFDAKKQAEQDKLESDKWAEFSNAMRGGDADKALAALDELKKLDPEGEERIEMSRLSVLVRVKKDAEAGRALAAKLADGACAKDAGKLMQIASTITYGEKVDKDSAKLAERILEQASKLEGEGDMKLYILKLQAKVWASQGEYDKAIEAETKVVDGITGSRKRFEERTLKEYKDAADAAKSKV